MPHPLTPPELAEFADAVQKRRATGETMWSIAGALGCSTSALKRRLHLAGAPVRATPGRPAIEFTPEQAANIRARYEAGASMRDIGTDLGYSDKVIARVLRTAGTTIRPRHRHAAPTAYRRSS